MDLRYKDENIAEKTDVIETSVLHARARESSLESRKLLINLNSGLIVFTFLAVIGTELEDLSILLRIILGINLVVLSTSLISGTYAWIADARRNYWLAKKHQTTNKNKKQRELFQKEYIRWDRRKKKCDLTLRYGFSAGILIYGIFIILYLIGL